MAITEAYEPTGTEVLDAIVEFHNNPTQPETTGVATLSDISERFAKDLSFSALQRRIVELRDEGLIADGFIFPGLESTDGRMNGSYCVTGYTPTQAGLEDSIARETKPSRHLRLL